MLNKWLLITFLSLLSLTALAVGQDELLAPDDAFAFSAREAEPGVIEAQFRIAPGYYLYREKFKFETADGVALGDAQFPPGQKKKDEFFGEVETYRDTIAIRIPVKLAQGAAGEVDFRASYQGCADVGVCYPPQRKSLRLTLAQAPAAAPVGAAKGSVLSDLRDDLGGQPELLPPDEAFAFRPDLAAPNLLVAEWRVADGYYLYKDKLKLSVEGASGASLGSPVFPPAERHDDPTFGSVEIYRGVLRLEYPILGLVGAPSSLTVKAQYQGCADIGVCYPPMQKAVAFEPAQLALLSGAEAAPPAAMVAAAPAASASEPLSEQDAIAGRLASGNTLLTLVSFFGFGLLLAFTPCVFPMIPILSGIIVGHGHKLTTAHAFMLSLAYVLAMAFAYTVVGVLAGLFGANLQAWFQNPWVLSVFAAIFVLLALSMFGFYELQMPSSIQSRLTMLSNKQEGGKLASAAIMGFLSAIIVGPCVTAPLIGALIYIGQTGDAVLGGAALFALSLGMGLPLLLIGTSAGKLLPRAGAWMDAVKAVFGVLLLAVALWMLERVLPAAVTMLLWAVLLIVSGVYMGALRHLPHDVSGWYHLWKGLGYVLVLYGSLLVVGAAGGGRDVLQPLKGVFASGGGAGTAIASGKLEFLPIKGTDGLDKALASAAASGRPAMLDFYADWCISCKEMEKFTFSDPQVQATLGKAVLLKADVTANDEQDRALLKAFGLIGPPAILFFDATGTERKNYRVVGFVPAAKFNAHAEKALR